MYILYLIRLLNISESLHTHPIKSSTAKYSSESGVIPEKAGISFSSFLSSLGDAKHSQKKKDLQLMPQLHMTSHLQKPEV